MRKLIIVILFLSFIQIGYSQKQTYTFANRDGVELKLDRYAALNISDKPRTCVMFVFGGGFANGKRDKAHYTQYFNTLTAAGYDVVSIDYRLGMSKDNLPSGKMTLRSAITSMSRAVNWAVEDLFTATKFVLENAKEWGIDPTKIVVSGSSAGAITALQAENYICNGHKLTKILPDNFNYGGVISFAGAIFSTKGKPKWGSKPCPIMFFHGNSDSNVPYKKAAVFGIGYYGSELIVKQLSKLNTPYWFYSAIYRDHTMATEPMQLNHLAILDFISRYVVNGYQLQIKQEVVDKNIPKQPTSFSIKQYLSSNYK